MDDGQKWAVACARQALADFGYPGRKLDLDRTAVILGNAMAGERHYMTALRVFLPEYAESLTSAPTFGGLPLDVRDAITAELQRSVRARLPDITEDTMPGELSNCIAGRVANLFNLRGPNYVVDAACASAMAAISAAIEGLDERDFDTVIAGGIDRNMGPSAYVKFCKIGALSATGTRPYAAGADGFVMGEGAALFLLKRLADAERDGDRVYAVIRGIGGSSDGKGKGITAPNPVGQKLAITRAWENAALAPATATLVEGHGTSTRVGDVVETQSLTEVFGASALPRGSIALGSVKSNIGHLKAAAGAAGLLKVVMALRDKVLPPSINFERPNPDIDFAHSPFAVNRELRPWDEPACGVRRAGLSAFGFGGTNFHLVLEEFVPGRLTGGRDRGTIDVPDALVAEVRAPASPSLKPPLRGALVVGASSPTDLLARLTSIGAAAAAGRAPAFAPPAEADLRAPVRLAIDYGDAAELAAKVDRAKKALAGDNPVAWKALRGQGLFLGEGAAPKVAFLYTGQGSQYVNMLAELAATEPVVKDVFAEADAVMAPLLGRPLTEYVFVDATEPSAVAEAEEHLRQTAITQPAVLAADTALTRLLAAYGVVPDVVMGHSLGEYAALVAAGALPFADALEAVSARGREMTNVSVADNGRMAAVMAPLKDVERILASIDGYVVIANLNSNQQAVIGGASAAVAEAIERFRDAGFGAVPLNVSHAFHTEIVAPASQPLRRTLERLRLGSPRLPVVANVDGGFYPTGAEARERMLDILSRQVASPVQFVAGLRTLHASGVRLYVEVGPKRALAGFVDDVFGGDHGVVALHTNHPKGGDRTSFNQALCGLYAAGLGAGARAAGETRERGPLEPSRPQASTASVAPASLAAPASAAWDSAAPRAPARLEDLGRMFAEVLERGWQVYRGGAAAPTALSTEAVAPVVVTGAALGLPGAERVFDDANVSRILHGQQFIDLIPTRFRRAILDKHITRLAKKADGAASFEAIDSPGDVIKLAGRAGLFDLADEFGVALERLPALDVVTRLAIGAGLDALRDAGIPLVRRYKTTSKGTRLPDRWMLPEALRDDTAVVFASAFPGLDSFASDLGRFHADRTRREKLTLLARLRARVDETAPNALRLLADLDEQIHEVELAIEREPYTFDRRFLFRILAMGHSQFAELIGARGPNTHVNAACASTTQAVAVAEDWIREGRARRVIVVSGDDVTSENLLEWIGAGFLASGAAATDDVVEEAAIPFDRRRHGMILGMGAAAFVIERADDVQARGLRPICEVLAAITANSAFHGTRIDVEHVAAVMESLVGEAERRHGIRRDEIAANTVFVSHETYTPARGGSAAAEVHALRRVFGAAADRIVIANTKGFTGHAMGVGIEDVVAMKALETGLVPPVANFKEADPELGRLNLSKGGVYPVRYALRLGAGFGSQISMTLCRWVASPDGSRPSPDQLGYPYRIADPAAFGSWLDRIAGHAGAELEVVKRTLRVVDAEAEARGPEAPRSKGQVVTALAAPPVVQAPAPDVPAAVPAAGTPAAPPPAPPVTTADPVKEQVLALFAEKTGYPRDMLADDLDLEADLGIDTVKQAELFATVRETFAIPRDEKLKLRDFPTLGHVVGFVRERRPDLVSTPPAAAAVAAATTAPPPVGPASSSAAGSPAGAADPVAEQVLALFAEKTGYPRDMLDPELDLEADLGIDTVKQAELFATVRETFAIPRDEKLKLRDFPTLGHVVGFVKERRPDLVSTPPAAAAVAAATTAPPPVGSASSSAAGSPAGAADPVAEQVLALFAEKTGYPRDMLDPELDLEADLGIDTVKQAELFATVRETFAIPRDEKLKLRDFPTLGHVVGFVKERRPDLVSTPPAAAAVAAATTAPPPVGPASSSAAGSPAGAADPVAEQVLALFAEKTGYPRDMLDPELDLEADLGIDTVKQAELFATVRETFAIPRDEKLKLRDFPTLGHVVGFVKERRPDLVSTPPAAAAVAAATTAPPPVGPASSSAAGSPAGAADPVAEQVLALFAEKTGYPRDMLDPELDLEADLGIDTVKQAELFATVRETFAIPRDEKLKLRDFPTLGHVVGFVRERRPDLVSAPPGAPAPAEDAAASDALAAIAAPAALVCDLDAADAIPRRVPVAVLRPAIALAKATRVVLGPGERVLVMPDVGGVAKALVRQLKKRGVRTVLLDPGATAESLERALGEALEAGPIRGVYWLPALDPEGDLGSFDLVAWRTALALRVKLLYTTVRKLYEALAAPGSFLVAATRLGGRHGYDEVGALHPLGGAVTGFTKTVKRERRDALVKAVDFEDALRPSEAARRLVEETLFDPGVVEVGWCDDLRFGIALEERPVTNGAAGLELGRDSVFLVTGAAGGITSAIVADLAAASGGIFHLLDLVGAPDPDDPDLARFTSDKEGLKRDLFERIKARGERATPALVERELAALERALAALTAIRAVESAGGRAHYHRVDLRDPAMVEAAVAEARRTSGRIDVLLHAGGLEVSRFLPDKPPAEFDLVFDVKSDGWFNLMKALGETPIGATVAFSSVAGRFGNGGQADYAAANDLLCKLTSNLRIRRPETRAIVIDWTAWSGIGMASRGSIPKMMAAAGIDMLPAPAGIPIVRRELTGGATRGELVIGQRLGVLIEEWDEHGGLDVAKVPTGDAGPMVGVVAGMRLHDGLVADVTLDPRAQPFLRDHQIDGTPVLPGVMGIEGFVELARLALPGWHVAAIENVRFLAPCKFYRNEPRTLRLIAQFHRDGDELVAVARLVASRAVMGQAEAQPTTHFTARLRLSKSTPRASRTSEPPGPDPERASVAARDVYRIYFHGPAYRVVEEAWRGGGGAVARLAIDLPANHEPPGLPLFAAPRLVELCFQTAGVWQLGTEGRMALPHAIESLTVYPGAADARGAVHAATLARAGGIDAYVIDGAGRTLVTLRGYRTIELPDPVDEVALAPLRAAMA